MKIPIGILGATGIVGQKYINRLASHPLFEIVYLAASEHSAGKTYEEAVIGRWHEDIPIPKKIASLLVYPLAENCQAISRCRLLFSALDNEAAIIFEPYFANIGFAIVSNASWGRKEADIPIIIPEINADHLSIIPIQQKNRSWKGFIVAKPCCTVQSYLIALGILHKKFVLEKIFVTSFQSLSGAGWPGIAAIDILDNIIPFIRGEEEKCEEEPLKILGSIGSSSIIKNNQICISSHCNRVPVLNGHLSCVSFSLKDKNVTKKDLLNTWASAPKGLIHYTESEDRPQPRKDKDRGLGMTISIGRLRTCPLLDFRLVTLSHNTVRGAAGGGILTAELLLSKGLI